MSVAVRQSGEPMRAGEFCVPSRTFPGETWTVVWQTDGLAWCGCPRFALRSTCRHVEQVALAIEVEVRQSLEQSTPERRAMAAARLDQIAQEMAR